MKRIFILSLAFIVIAGLIFASKGSFYRPGKVREEKGLRSPLSPPSQEGVKPNFWKVEEDILIYYFNIGKGAPIVVIHGGPGFPPTNPWRGLEALKESFQFYFYHQRGCGQSTKPVDRFESQNYLQNMVNLDKVLGISSQLADIERIRRILGQEKLIIIGHSYGGFLATLYAIEFPEHVKKMILIAPAAVLRMPVEEGGFEQLKDFLSEAMKKEFEDFLARYFDYGNIFQKNEQGLAKLNFELVKFYEAAYSAEGANLPDGAEIREEDIGGWMVHAMYFSLGLKYDIKQELKKVEAPVLVIHGENDVMPSLVSKEYADLFHSGQYKEQSGTTHFPFLERPKEFAALVKEFLKNSG